MPSYFSEGNTPLPTDTRWKLLQKILGATIDGGGGGGGGSGGGAGAGYLYEYTNPAGPTAQGLLPNNTTLPALAYDPLGVGDMYTWSVGAQAWV